MKTQLPVPLSGTAAGPEYYGSLGPSLAGKTRVSNKARQENRKIKLWNGHIMEHYTAVTSNNAMHRTMCIAHCSLYKEGREIMSILFPVCA